MSLIRKHVAVLQAWACLALVCHCHCVSSLATCPHCNCAKETAEHRVFQCPAHAGRHGPISECDPRCLCSFLETSCGNPLSPTGNDRERDRERQTDREHTIYLTNVEQSPTFGTSQSFRVAGRLTWNDLPDDVTSA